MLLRLALAVLLALQGYIPTVPATPTSSGPGFSSGDLMVCGMTFNWNANYTKTNDSLNSPSTSWPTLASNGAVISGEQGLIVYYANSASGHTDTITITLSAAYAGAAVCAFFKNIATSAPDDAGTNNPATLAGQSGANPTSSAFQTTAATELGFSLLRTTSVTPTASTGTLLDPVSSAFTWPQYWVTGSASSSNTAAYTATSDTWGMLWGSFKNNGGTPALDGACYANGTSSTGTITVTITC